MNGVTEYVVGVIIGVGISLIVSLDDPTVGQVGSTYKEIRQMKEECEKELPRNKQCVPVLTFKVED